MTQLVSYAFIGGELDRPFYSRTDLAKYPLGVALSRNYYIDFRGGLKSRPGFLYVQHLFANARLFEFPTGDFTEPVIVVVTEGKTYLMQEDEFLAGDPVTISGLSTSTQQFTVPDGAPWSVGDLFYTEGADGHYYLRQVQGKSGATLTYTLPFGVPQVLSASFSSVRRVRSWNNPYGPVCLTQLQANFDKNRLEITCNTRPPHELVFENDDFTFGPVDFSPSLSAPSGLTFTTFRLDGSAGKRTKHSDTGNARGIYAVAAVDASGVESIIGYPVMRTDMFNFLDVAGLCEISWTALAGAKSYRLYRSMITEGELDISTGLGFLGETTTAFFTDNNVVPDYSRPPRFAFDPFANGAVLELTITGGGSGYLQTERPAVTLTGGTGFVGYAVIRGGSVSRIIIANPGRNYTTSSAVTIAPPASGTAATATVAAVTPPTGNNPATATRFQSRKIYAGTNNLPVSFFASRTRSPRDFSSLEPPSADDSFIFAVDASEAVPIRHIMRARNGFLLMHSLGIDRVIPGSTNTISAVSRQIENQAEIGVSRAVPAKVNDDLIFATPRGSSVISMAYTFYTNSYTPQDVSVLAAHLFGAGQAPVRFEWVSEPDKLLWVLREDGHLLTLTYMKEQETFAWAQHQTAGVVRDILKVRRPDRDVLYAVVQREDAYIIEKLADRRVAQLADYVGCDSALVRKYETAQTEVNNLWHLEGQTVSVLADGDALLNRTVVNGSITLDNAASTFIVGLPFMCDGLSLPMSDPQKLEDKRRLRPIGLSLSLLETRGLELGVDERAVYPMKDKGWEDWGAPIDLRSDITYVNLQGKWERGQQLIMRQRYPLPTHILGYAVDVEIE